MERRAQCRVMTPLLALPVLVLATWPALALVAQEAGTAAHEVAEGPNRGSPFSQQQLIEIEQHELKKAAGRHRQVMDEAKAQAKRIMVQSLLAAARRAYQDKRYEGAEQLAQEALEVDPTNQTASAQLHKARQAKGLGTEVVQGKEQAVEQVEQAAEALAKAFEIAPVSLEALAQRPEAQGDGAPRAKAQPTTFRTRLQGALRSLENGDYLQGQKGFLLLLDELRQSRQEAQAQAVVKEATQRIKESSVRAFTSITEAQLTKTEQSLLEILEMLKTLAEAKKQEEDKQKVELEAAHHMTMALRYVDQENYEAAKGELQRVLSIEPTHPQAVALVEKINDVMEVLGGKQP